MMKSMLFFLFLSVPVFSQTSWEGCETGNLCKVQPTCEIKRYDILESKNEQKFGFSVWQDSCEKKPLAIYDKTTHSLKIPSEEEQIFNYAIPTFKLRVYNEFIDDSVIIKLLEYGFGYCRLNIDNSDEDFSLFELLFAEIPMAAIYENRGEKSLATAWKDFSTLNRKDISSSKKELQEKADKIKKEYLQRIRSMIFNGECFVNIKDDYLTLEPFEDELMSAQEFEQLIKDVNLGPKEKGFIEKSVDFIEKNQKYFNAVKAFIPLPF